MTRSELRNERITVPVEKLVYGGDALARVNGQVMLLPFALPGEEVEVEPQPGKGKMLRGHKPRILNDSPHRVEPGCEYFGRCGGCQYQHAAYDYQVEQKAAILRETLARLGHVQFSGEIQTITGDPWQYRNRIQLHFDRGKVGYRRHASHELCAVTHCPISSPKLNQVIGVLTDLAKQPQWPRFLHGLELFTNEADVQMTVTETDRPVAERFFQWCAEAIPGFASGAIIYTAAGHGYQVSRNTFFQVNRFLVNELVREVVENSRGKFALDLYAGAGLFSLPLARHFERVHAVERGGSAFRDLEHNASGNREQITATQNTSDDFLEGMAAVPDLVVADPPRSGLGTVAAQHLLRLAPPKLIIVSCDPATLARDLQTLTRRYEMERLTLVDLFPQTFHFETVAHLALKN